MYWFGRGGNVEDEHEGGGANRWSASIAPARSICFSSPALVEQYQTVDTPAAEGVFTRELFRQAGMHFDQERLGLLEFSEHGEAKPGSSGRIQDRQQAFRDPSERSLGSRRRQAWQKKRL